MHQPTTALYVRIPVELDAKLRAAATARNGSSFHRRGAIARTAIAALEAGLEHLNGPTKKKRPAAVKRTKHTKRGARK